MACGTLGRQFAGATATVCAATNALEVHDEEARTASTACSVVIILSGWELR